MATPLKPGGHAAHPRTCTRGAKPPYAIRWFGSTALLGHLRHLGAERLASSNRDVRDWMRPQRPEALLAQIAAVLEAPHDGSTLAERLGREVWIDFVSDTGDDSDVSGAVATLVSGEYAVDELTPSVAGHAGATSDTAAARTDDRLLPRGDLLVFGGDTAYPVASAFEIARRLTRPWNSVLRRAKGPWQRRVLLGVPGNHDWYDGLDGFARLFRRDSADDLTGDTPANGAAGASQTGTPGAAGGRIFHDLHLDELEGSMSLAKEAVESVSAALRGGKVRRAPRLMLHGYRAVQEASYWLLPLAPGLDLWGADRQLRTVDFRQRVFFRERLAHAGVRRHILVCSDPAEAMGEPNEPGQQILKACGLAMREDPTLFLTGDSHHYERRRFGPSQQVIAGGGGAFVHGTRVHAYRPGTEPERTYPDAVTSRRLAASVPWHIVKGTAGLLPHLFCALLAWLQVHAFAIGPITGWSATAVLAAASVVAMVATMSLKGNRPGAAMGVAAAHGVALALLPLGIGWLFSQAMGNVLSELGTAVVMGLAGPLLVGHYLLILVVTGLDPWTAYSTLGHPGYKHFVRLCVHPSGRVDGWVIGKDNPLSSDPPTLIDRFSW